MSTAIEVVMPQLGETVAEGTITRWFKQVGEPVEADEPLFEVSTDKVDSEIPAPVSGVVSEILVAEGDTVEVGTRLAVISAGAVAEAAAVPPAPQAPAPAPAPAPPPAPAPAPATAPEVAAPAAPATAPGGAVTSPLVRRLLAEHGLDESSVAGTGDGGRITRNDVLAAARGQARRPAAPPRETAPGSRPPVPSREAASARGDSVVPFDNLRTRTAEHMVRSKATSAHVYTSMLVDFERVERARRAHLAQWKAEEGFSLTYLPFVARAFCDVVHDYPHVNASVEGDSLVVHRDIHLAIAVDLDFRGLLAPVIRDADGKRLRLLARDVHDLATRARNKTLGPDEVVGGTFTITNMGPFGTLMTLPIINQPQVAILATDEVRKQPVVVEGPDGEDTIAVHHVGLLSLAWDHRAFDGAYAAAFLAGLRDVVETRDWESELA